MELVKPNNNGQPCQFAVNGPYIFGDKSLKFHVTMILPSPVIGGVAEVLGYADVHVKNAKAGMALALALKQIADQLPADLVA